MENIKLCETCGKEHDGLYGSGRFCSYSCRQKFSSMRGASKGGQSSKQKYGKKCKCKVCGLEFETKLALKKHWPNCEKRIKYKAHNNWECHCGKVFRTRCLLQEHRQECELCKNSKGVTIAKKTYIDFKCEFCRLERKTTKEAATNHLKHCKENPNRIEPTHHKHRSEESKKKISEARKKYLNEHPDKVPFKLNHSSKESYPEKYFREWLQKENIFSEKEYSVERYSLDFAWPEKGIYLEIDGGQHTLNWMKDHDKERTDFLTEKGWVCIARVFWPHFCSFNNDEKIRFLKNLKNTILTSEVFHDFQSEKELLQKKQQEYREELARQGKINSLGRPCNYMNSTEGWEIRKNKILSCGVDLSKIGWKVKVQNATGLTRRQVDLTIDKFYNDFESLIFTRKNKDKAALKEGSSI